MLYGYQSRTRTKHSTWLNWLWLWRRKKLTRWFDTNRKMTTTNFTSVASWGRDLTQFFFCPPDKMDDLTLQLTSEVGNAGVLSWAMSQTSSSVAKIPEIRNGRNFLREGQNFCFLKNNLLSLNDLLVGKITRPRFGQFRWCQTWNENKRKWSATFTQNKIQIPSNFKSFIAKG